MTPSHARLPAARMAVTCLLAACLPVAWLLPAPATAQTVTLNQGGKDVRIAVGDAASLPADFPQDIPLPEPHAIVRVQRAGAATTVVIETPGTVEGVAAWFDAGMRAHGWTRARVKAPQAGVAQAWERERRAVVAWWQPSANGVQVQLELLPPR
jgi:hypothetical protein